VLNGMMSTGKLTLFIEERKKKEKKREKKNIEKYFYKNRIFDDVKTQK